jgi:DNA-directed RNA polymerase specialized sigma24 family protein
MALCVPPEYENLSDHELVELTRCGVLQAFDELDRRYRPGATKTISRRLDKRGAPGRQWAEDDCQEAFMDLFVKIRRGNVKTGTHSSLKGLIHRMAWRRAGRRLRSLAKNRRSAAQDSPRTGDAEESGDQQLDHNEEKQLAWRRYWEVFIAQTAKLDPAEALRRNHARLCLRLWLREFSLRDSAVLIAHSPTLDCDEHIDGNWVWRQLEYARSLLRR